MFFHFNKEVLRIISGKKQSTRSSVYIADTGSSASDCHSALRNPSWVQPSRVPWRVSHQLLAQNASLVCLGLGSSLPFCRNLVAMWTFFILLFKFISVGLPKTTVSSAYSYAHFILFWASSSVVFTLLINTLLPFFVWEGPQHTIRLLWLVPFIVGMALFYVEFIIAYKCSWRCLKWGEMCIDVSRRQQDLRQTNSGKFEY